MDTGQSWVRREYLLVGYNLVNLVLINPIANTRDMKKDKKFRDPIHGFISVSPVELKIINSPIFQRTRNIKQLSLGHYVYHGAEHSRFGHMIGAAHLAGRAFDSLINNAEELGQTLQLGDTDRATLRMAALLHDIGHTPFSHALDSIFGPAHEKYSQKLVSICFEDTLKKADIDADIVNNLIDGDPYPEKPYLSKIISGQLDVDRLDYLLRDSHYSGVSYGRYDLSRIIEQLAVVDNRFVVLQGGYEAVEQFIFARYQMYQQVYFHKTKRVFELMLGKCGKIVKESGFKYLQPEDLEDGSKVEEYAQYDDRWFLNFILKESKSDLRIKTIADMIKNRKPYWEVYSPILWRKKSTNVKPEPHEPLGELELVEGTLKGKLGSLGIEKHEFLTDEASRPLYKLMPDYIAKDEDDGEGSSISIYYENNQLIEPIEKRSRVVHVLGTHQPFMKRGFVIPEKYNSIRDYLKDELKFVLPEREL